MYFYYKQTQKPQLRHFDMTDQSALGPDGELLDVSKIEWFNDPDDTHPIQPTSDVRHGIVFLSVLIHRSLLTDYFLARSSGRTATGARLAAAMAAENLAIPIPDQLYLRRPATLNPQLPHFCHDF